MAWEITYGVIGPGLDVGQECGNLDCVRPAHLYLATHFERRPGGGGRCGVAHPRAKLTEELVLEARRRRGAGEGLATIASDYGVSAMAISLAVRGKSWRHLRDPDARERP